MRILRDLKYFSSFSMFRCLVKQLIARHSRTVWNKGCCEKLVIIRTANKIIKLQKNMEHSQTQWRFLLARFFIHHNYRELNLPNHFKHIDVHKQVASSTLLLVRMFTFILPLWIPWILNNFISAASWCSQPSYGCLKLSCTEIKFSLFSPL
jgi:hypothetical protein